MNALVSAVAAALLACSSADAAPSTIHVTMTYLERFGLPRGTRYSATLLELRDDESVELSTAVRATEGEQPPLRLTLEYEPQAVHPRSRYRIDATIEFRTEVLFRGSASLADPLPDAVRLTMRRVP